MDFSANNDDVLEIAAYGTQAVRIKKEEEPLVSIKNEFANDEEFGDSSNTDMEKIPQIDDLLTCTPLVYTTKLDEMTTFKKIYKLTARESTEMILVESRPLYKQNPVQIKREPTSVFNISSYNKLRSQVQQFNAIVQSETYLRNEKLLKMCKPFKIVLEDLNKQILAAPIKHARIEIDKSLHFTEKLLTTKLTVDRIEFEESSDDDVCLWKLKSESHANKANKIETPKVRTVAITVAIKDKRSQEADIYIIDASLGVISYYRTGIDEFDKIHKLHESRKRLILEYCCWVNREKRIRKFIITGFARVSVYHFLRNPHNCLPRPCSCCCVSGTPVPKQTSNDELIKHIINKKNYTEGNNGIYGNDQPVRTHNVIEKAYNYKPKFCNKKNISNDNTYCLNCAKIVMKYRDIMLSQTNIFGETYVIGKQGYVTDYVRSTVIRSFTEEKHQKIESNKKIIYFEYIICCWHRRENLLNQLRHSNKLSPTALTFMRTSHHCRSNECECCCKPTALIDFKLEDAVTSNIISLNKKQIKVNVPVNKKDIYQQITNSSRINYISRSINYRVKNIVNKKKIRAVSPSKKENSYAKPTATLEMPNTFQNNIDMPIDTCLNENPINSKNTKTQVQPNAIYTTNQNNVKSTNPVITNYLDRLKNLKLSVNDNGKLIAVIGAQAGELNTAEIKILSDILLLAWKQIKQLGITAQEFCNRVNASRAGNALVHSSLLHPKPSNTINTNDNQSNLPTEPQKVRKHIQSCKAHPLKSEFPMTNNKTPVCSIYQTMSTIGGRKNEHLVKAFKLYFKDNVIVNARADKVQRFLNESALLLANNDSRKNNYLPSAPVEKRKAPPVIHAPKKLRVIPYENLPKHLKPIHNPGNLNNGFVNTMDKIKVDKAKVSISAKATEHEEVSYLAINGDDVSAENKSRKIFVTQDINQVPLGTNKYVKIIENTNKVIPTENTSTSDPLEPRINSIDVDISLQNRFLNESALLLANNDSRKNNYLPSAPVAKRKAPPVIHAPKKLRVIPYENLPKHLKPIHNPGNLNNGFVNTMDKIKVDKAKVSISAKATEHEEVSYLAINGDDVSAENKSRKIFVTQDINQVPLGTNKYVKIIENTNKVIPTENTSTSDPLEPRINSIDVDISLQNRVPILETKPNHINDDNIYVIQNPIATDHLQPSITQVPRIVPNSEVKMLGTISSILPKPKSVDKNITEILGNNPITPVQNNTALSVSSSVPSDNPILYKMLSKGFTKPISTFPLSVLPHTEGSVPVLSKNIKTKRKNNNDSADSRKVAKPTNPSPSHEVDVETSIITNFIIPPSSLDFPQYKIIAVDDKQLINDNEDEEGIFGV